LAELATLTDAKFREKFSGSPIKRIGRDQFVRNAAIAIGNSGNPALEPIAQALTTDPNQVVAEAASWAMCQLTTDY
jgi:epoxyqueuosine reductase